MTVRIDDFEDGDTRMISVDKRAGYWIAFNDGTAKQTTQRGFATRVAFDARSIYSIEFQMFQDQPFDVWLDDVAFLER